jgi:molybdate transport system ATP-binding protein
MLLEVDITKKLGAFSCHYAFSLVGERCGVFGPSGCGKSTLINMSAGLLTPDSGCIVLDGRTLFDKDRGINLPPERRCVGMVFQEAYLFPHMNVEKNLLYGMKRLPAHERHIEPERLIAALRLGPLLKRGIRQISGGERQRVALGRAILACPRLILLDEPLTGLDERLKHQIIREIREIFAEFSLPLLFISHNLQEMRLMTKEVLVMEAGQIARRTSSEELARSDFATGEGYSNLLDFGEPEDLGDMYRYPWGNVALILPKRENRQAGRFSLHGRDILLFTERPKATSARNILNCLVTGTYQNDWLVGVEMNCQGQTLIAEIVPQLVRELAIRPGSELVAVIKASAFKRLY